MLSRYESKNIYLFFFLNLMNNLIILFFIGRLYSIRQLNPQFLLDHLVLEGHLQRKWSRHYPPSMRCSSHSFFNFPTPCLSYLAFETTFCKPVLLKLRNECCRNLSLWLFLTQRHSQNVQPKKLIPGARYNIYFLKDFFFHYYFCKWSSN